MEWKIVATNVIGTATVMPNLYLVWLVLKFLISRFDPNHPNLLKLMLMT